MSTYDVPGAKAHNHDELAMGCWAEHEDGSLILVESTEGGRVVYSIFDVSTDPVTEYRDTMAEGAFKKLFSWNSTKPESEKWTWHDKTPFDFDRVIVKGARDGTRYASADDQLNAAERLRRSRDVRRGQTVEPDQLGEREAAKEIVRRIQRALDGLL